MYRLSTLLKNSNVWINIDKLNNLTPQNVLESSNLCDVITNKLYQIINDHSKFVNVCLKLSSISNVKKDLYIQLKRGVLSSFKEFDPIDSVIALEAFSNFYLKGFNTQNIPNLILKNLISSKQIQKLDLLYIPKLLESIHIFKIDNRQLIADIEKRIKCSYQRLDSDPNTSVSLLKNLCLVAPSYKILIGKISNIIFIKHSSLSINTLIDCFYSLCKADYYPRFADSIDLLFLSRFPEITDDDLIKLLHCYGLIYARNMTLLDKLITRFQSIITFNIDNSIDILYNLYKLRISDQAIIDAVNMMMLNAEYEKLDSKRLINYLTAIVYFKINNLELYNRVLPQITRHLTTLNKEGLTQLKINELAIRLGYVPNIYNNLSESSKHLLQLIYDSNDVLELYETSKFQKEVGEVALHIRHRLNTEVKIGPYMVDFISPISVGEMYNSNNYNENHVSEGIIIEVDGPRHFYKNTHMYICHSIMKDELMLLMGYRIIHVKYYDWEKLYTTSDKKLYLEYLNII